MTAGKLSAKLAGLIEFAISIGTAKKVLGSVRKEYPGLKMFRPSRGLSSYIPSEHQISVPRRSKESLESALHEHGHVSAPKTTVDYLQKSDLPYSEQPGFLISEEYRANRDILSRIKKHGSSSEVQEWRKVSQKQIKEGYRNPHFEVEKFLTNPLEHNKLSTGRTVLKESPWLRKQSLSAVMNDLIQFKRGKYLDRVMRTAPHEEAVAAFHKHTGLRALPTRGPFNKMLKDPEMTKGLAGIAKELKRYMRPRVLSTLDNLIEFKRGYVTGDAWVDNPLYPTDIKSSVQHVPIKHIISHQETVKSKIVKEYKKKPGRDLPTLHKVGKKYFVEDGNHRIVAKREKGEKTVRARVFEKELIAKLDDLIQFAALHQPRKEDEAPGVLPTFKEGELLDYNIQRHAARRAGLHRDVRIGNKRHGLLSWATRQVSPDPGKSIAIHEQPVHPHSYLGWSGTIPSGYGAGDVKSEDLRKALVTKSSSDQLHATLAGERGSHRVAFVKTKSGWLLSKGRSPQPPPEAQKPPAKSISPEEATGYLKQLPPGSSVQPKVDGALVYIGTAGGRPEIFSHRVSGQTGEHPVHTERVFRGRPHVNIPREHQRTLIGELYGKIGAKAIPPQSLGGILNAHIDESIRKQKAAGVKLKVMPFDYVDGQDEEYAERLAKVRQTLKHLPAEVFHAPEEAKTPEAAQRLHERIRSGAHPLTKEGIVIHPPAGKMIKVKHTEEANVKIHSTFPGTGKFEGSHGGFYYSDKSGKRLGKVGTGFDDSTRKELHKYVGRVARVRYQEKFPSGKLRAPAFIAVDEGK